VKRTIDGRTGLEVIDPDECRKLLASDDVGRLVVVHDGTPFVFPVNYALDGDAVVFRTAPGTKLTLGPRGTVAFEIDALDRAAHTGWSVVVTGHLDEVTPYDAEDFERVTSLPVQPWAGGDKPRWLRLVPTRVSGRRIGTPR
jgi:uncharacterized protein